MSLSRLRQVSSYHVDDVTGRLHRHPNLPPRFQIIVGLEIHAQLEIPTKLFSPARSTAAVTTSSGYSSNLHRPNSAIPRPPRTGPALLHPLDVAIPGYLPVLSKQAVQKAVLAAALFDCDIQNTSRFERKHYTFADLPSHYQITQQRWPLAVNGQIQATIELPTTKKKGTKKSSTAKRREVTCRVHRIQIEQDTGKTMVQNQTHAIPPNGIDNDDTNVVPETTVTTTSWSCVDFNRAGQALMELVLAPDLRTPLEAAGVTETVRQLLKHVGVCDGRMEESSFRCDVNINLEQVDVGVDHDDTGSSSSTTTQRRRSPRVEVKNLSSIRHVREAVEYEALRQAQVWDETEPEDGKSTHHCENQGVSRERTADKPPPPASETRMWNPSVRATELIRIKDGEEDYRFLPEPDLPPVILETSATPKHNDNDDNDTRPTNPILDGMDLTTFLQTHMPELPSEAMSRLQQTYGLTEYQASVITSDLPAIAFLDQAIAVATQTETKEEDVDPTKKPAGTVGRAATLTANLIINNLFALVKEHSTLGKTISSS